MAGEQGVSLDTVKAQITSDAEKKLDEAVTNGKLTQEKADSALAKLTDHKILNIQNKNYQIPSFSPKIIREQAEKIFYTGPGIYIHLIIFPHFQKCCQLSYCQ